MAGEQLEKLPVELRQPPVGLEAHDDLRSASRRDVQDWLVRLQIRSFPVEGRGQGLPEIGGELGDLRARQGVVDPRPGEDQGVAAVARLAEGDDPGRSSLEQQVQARKNARRQLLDRWHVEEGRYRVDDDSE